MHTCTIGPSAVTGARCGKPAVSTFVGTDGTIYAECADHWVRTVPNTPQIGDIVYVFRYGRNYPARVTRIGERGAVYATFSYGNGVQRTVRI
jgi:hypothetical protein